MGDKRDDGVDYDEDEGDGMERMDWKNGGDETYNEIAVIR